MNRPLISFNTPLRILQVLSTLHMCNEYGPYSPTAHCVLDKLQFSWQAYVLPELFVLALIIFGVLRFFKCSRHFCRDTCENIETNGEPPNPYAFMSYVYLVLAGTIAGVDLFFMIFYQTLLNELFVKISISFGFFVFIFLYRKIMISCNDQCVGSHVAALSIPTQLIEVAFFVFQLYASIWIVNQQPYADAHFAYLIFQIEISFFALPLLFGMRLMFKIMRECHDMDDEKIKQGINEEIDGKLNRIIIAMDNEVSTVIALGMGTEAIRRNENQV